jgi:plastocyanin
MRQALLAAALLFAFALAGCSGKDKDAEVQPVTCPDGTVLTAQQIEAIPEHNEAGFNATAHCPVKPSVHLAGIPANLGAFRTAAFSWSLDNGTVEHAHSMLTSIRWSERSVPDADLTNLNKYPTELVKREHQNLPVTYHGNLTFGKVGRIYLRAYMEVAGADYWSPEYAMNVTPVVATGKVLQVVQGVGDFQSPPAPDAQDAALGDALQFVNNDVRDHTCSYVSGPASSMPDLVAAQGGSSDASLLAVPGVYQYSCDDLQAKAFSVNVRVP